MCVRCYQWLAVPCDLGACGALASGHDSVRVCARAGCFPGPIQGGVSLSGKMGTLGADPGPTLRVATQVGWGSEGRGQRSGLRTGPCAGLAHLCPGGDSGGTCVLVPVRGSDSAHFSTWRACVCSWTWEPGGLSVSRGAGRRLGVEAEASGSSRRGWGLCGPSPRTTLGLLELL